MDLVVVWSVENDLILRGVGRNCFVFGVAVQNDLFFWRPEQN